MLLKEFKSFKKIKEASIEELHAHGLPQKVAENLYHFLRQEDKKDPQV